MAQNKLTSEKERGKFNENFSRRKQVVNGQKQANYWKYKGIYTATEVACGWAGAVM